VISVETDIIQSYANSWAGDRAGFFVVKERVVSAREKCIQFQKRQLAAGRASTPHSTADLLFFPCSALLFSAELPILRVFFAVFQFARPPYRDLQAGVARRFGLSLRRRPARTRAELRLS
jgi:hypothetical protein